MVLGGLRIVVQKVLSAAFPYSYYCIDLTIIVPQNPFYPGTRQSQKTESPRL